MIDQILAQASKDSFRNALQGLLLDICHIDTTPNPDITVMEQAESRVFDRIEQELSKLNLPGARTERRLISPAIADHPAFSKLHFTKTPERPEGLSPEQVYQNRTNLLCFLPGNGSGKGAAVNAHVDVVAPYIPPTVNGTTISGRGALDDKGNVVAMIGAFQLLDTILRANNKTLNGTITGMMVVEEETGGNGSLSLALDRELKKAYDSILVLECCDLQIHPANRGAVWYRSELKLDTGDAFEAAMWVIEELEKEGRSIKAESHHPLFPQRPVQTCHGIIGHIGEHPSRICAEVAFDITFETAPSPEIESQVKDCLEFALAEYIGRYGDKTQEMDSRTQTPKVAQHYEVNRHETGFTVAVHGKSGHMGAIDENDGAITKMSYMVRALMYSRAFIEQLAGTPMKLSLHGWNKAEELALEGGQGFVPTHDISTVMQRVANAAKRGLENFRRFKGPSGTVADRIKTTYDKLHNNAFDGNPDSLSMKNALNAAEICNIKIEKPVRGWTVSCDARLFANEYPEMPVLTSGPGKLEFAHSDDEKVDLCDITICAAWIAIWLLKETGTLD